MPKVLGIFLCLVALSVNAANVNVTASGTISEFFDPDGLLPFAEPPSGTIFTLKITYEDSTPDITKLLGPPDLDPAVGLYNNAVRAMTLDIGPQSFSSSSGNILVFDDIENDEGTAFVDLWIATSAGDFGMQLGAAEDSPPALPLSSDELVQPSWPGLWTFGTISYSISEEVSPEEFVLVARARAEIKSISVAAIPIPAAAWLFLSGLTGGLFWMRRYRA